MASDKLPPFVLGEDDPRHINIVNGPNDFDIFLCFRHTTSEVTFYLDYRTVCKHFNGSRDFLPAKILGMTHRPDHPCETILGLTGYTFEGNYRYYFEMRYDTYTRKGEVWFPNQGKEPR